MDTGTISLGHEGIVPGVSPQVYSQADFDRVSELAYQEAGIILANGKRMLVYSRIAPLLREAGCQTFAEYLGRVESDAEMRVRTVAALTTNHTYFNRESHHYEHFSERVRPGLIARANAGEKVRIWSAGCSSGEEIWTLMMNFLGEERSGGKGLSQKSIIALGTDLADHAINAAKKGEYPAKAMEEITEKLRQNWCKTDGDMIKVGEEMRRIVHFRRLNLLRSWPFKSQFDVIFCRNVMIYFDQPTKEKLVARLAQQLRPNGYLYIGHSERATGAGASLLTAAGPTIYQRNAV